MVQKRRVSQPKKAASKKPAKKVSHAKPQTAPMLLLSVTISKRCPKYAATSSPRA